MARGWESKSIESQQEEASRRPPAVRGPSTPIELDRAQRRQTLTLARQRVLADLQHACNPAHRSHLTTSLTALDSQIAALDPSGPQPDQALATDIATKKP